VRRTLKKPFDLEDKIKEISMIPGAGEYVYDTVVQEKTFGQQDVRAISCRAARSPS
jgi:hypothetical protein